MISIPSNDYYFPESSSETVGGDIPLRSSVPDGDTWDLAALYADETAWLADFERIDAAVAPILALKGTLSTPGAVRACLDAETELDRLLDRLYVYAHMKADEDTGAPSNQARETRVRSRIAEVSASLAWIRPELLSNDADILAAWLELEELIPHRYGLLNLVRQKAHVLSDAEERVLAGAAPLFGVAGETFKLLSNADLVFRPACDRLGVEKPMSHGRYHFYLQERDRILRRNAFTSMYDAFGKVKNTTACTLRSHVKVHNYLASLRGYTDALEAALSPDNVSCELYRTLIAVCHDALPYLHTYVDLRKKALRLDDLDMYDMYVPLVDEVDLKVPFDKAREWVMAACEPLGSEYTDILQTAFRDRWIDRYENKGKRSGAYSSGCYDSLPYVLMNYQGTLDDVFTLAHELGHSMHSWLANRHQPPQTAGYPIFIAEIASTLNEALLLEYLQRTIADGRPDLQAYLLNHFCDAFRGTVYRQTMFAEFEAEIHTRESNGLALTPDRLSDYYYELNTCYYGNAVKADAGIGLEWSRIPHFYYNFYVYKYATSFCASQIFAQRIGKSLEARDSYLGLLKGGGSDDPLVLIRNAGVDLLDRETLQAAFGRFSRSVVDLSSAL